MSYEIRKAANRELHLKEDNREFPGAEGLITKEELLEEIKKVQASVVKAEK